MEALAFSSSSTLAPGHCINLCDTPLAFGGVSSGTQALSQASLCATQYCDDQNFKDDGDSTRLDHQTSLYRSPLLEQFLVDMEFQEEVIRCSHKLLPIVCERLEKVKTLAGSKESHVLKYAEFLTLKIACEDFDSREMNPTAPVDKIWHAHILGNLAEYISFFAGLSVSGSWVNHTVLVSATSDMVRGMSYVRELIHAHVWPAPPTPVYVPSQRELELSMYISMPSKKRRHMENRAVSFDEDTWSTRRQGSRSPSQDDHNERHHGHNTFGSTRASDNVVDLDVVDSDVYERDDEVDGDVDDADWDDSDDAICG